MDDNVQRSFESLSINRPPQQQQPQNHLGLPSPLNGTISSNASSSLRSPSSTFGSGQLPGNGIPSSGDGQSAAARFERFFNSTGSPPPPSQGLEHSPQSLGFPPSPHHPASLGPGSSAAGLANSGAFGSFGHNFNSGAGSANAFMGNNSTLPALRSKPGNTRQGLPSQWNSLSSDDVSGTGSSPPHQFGQNSFLNAGNGSTAYPGVSNTIPTGGLGSGGDDDIIPTAIVVKNIPFSIKREQLLQIIEELHIPMPYAFNYHFDQGVFRGLAFANFRSGEEADAVVAALNGFDVSGRKLRVEYKKVLQAGEKERIEKEKAIKRMQSMQMEKERVRRQTISSATGEEWNPQFAQQSTTNYPSVPALAGVGSSAKLSGTELETGYSDAYNEAISPSTQDLIRSNSDSQNEMAAGSSSEAGGKKEELDLNDPATLEIYSRVLLFKDDRMRDELSFSKNLTTNERRIVHMVSKKLNLYHYSLGEGDERYVIVTKNEVNQPQRPLRSQASTIGRNHRIGEGLGGGNSMTGANGLLAPGSSFTMGRNALRTKKSAPDMKRQRERSDDGAFGVGGSYGFVSGSASNGGSVHGAFGSAGLSRKSNGNLREGYSSSVGRRSVPSSGGGGAAGLQSLFSSPFDIPPVPSLPTNIGGDPHSYSPSPSPIGTNVHSNNGSFSAATSQHILRQPAGPGAANRNFAQRSRVPFGGMANGQGVGQDGTIGSYANGHSDIDGIINNAGPGDLREDDIQTHQPLEV